MHESGQSKDEACSLRKDGGKAAATALGSVAGANDVGAFRLGAKSFHLVSARPLGMAMRPTNPATESEN